MRRKSIVLITATILFTMLICTSLILYGDRVTNMYQYSRAALSYYGSTGQEVINVQAKLYNWGYYHGIVDGAFGYETYRAVREFQYRNGLTVDGIVGPETLRALGLPTGTTPTASQTSASADSNTNLLAHLIYGEARGEPYTGQVAVGAVIINRTRDARFPKTIAGVIYQPGAFDAVYDGQINMNPDQSAFNAAVDALNGWDPSGGAVYYWNPATATSSWIWSRTIITQIGNHVFAR